MTCCGKNISADFFSLPALLPFPELFLFNMARCGRVSPWIFMLCKRYGQPAGFQKNKNDGVSAWGKPGEAGKE